MREWPHRWHRTTGILFTLTPTFHSYVLISPSARIDRPKKFNSSRVIKADMLLKTIENQFEKNGVIDTFTNVARMVSLDTMTTIGRQLMKNHKPISINYVAKFGLTEKPEPVKDKPAVKENSAPNYSRGAMCYECGVKVDNNVSYFCRLNKYRFKGKIFCRECQLIPEAETL